MSPLSPSLATLGLFPRILVFDSITVPERTMIKPINDALNHNTTTPVNNAALNKEQASDNTHPVNDTIPNIAPHMFGVCVCLTVL